MPTVTTLVPGALLGTSEANGINDFGAVVGQEGQTFAFLWEPHQPNGTSGIANQLPMLPAGSNPTTARAWAVNTRGDVVGECGTITASGQDVSRATFWRAGGGALADLGTLIPDPLNPGSFLGSSRAIDLNDGDLVVGWSDDPNGRQRAIVFDRSTGVMTDLGALVVDGNSRATSVNNQGDIVGVSDADDAAGNAVERAFLLPAGSTTMIDLGTIQPDPFNPGWFLESSRAYGINGNGTIVGSSDAGGGLTAATSFFSPPVSVLPSHSDGYDVGPFDEVLGTAGANLDEAFVFDATGFVDLTTLTGTTITSATGINAAGQISAIALIGGDSVGVLITP